MKALLSVTGTLEAATGLALVIAPSAVISLLLNAPLETSAGLTVARLAGIALFSLGAACWFARTDTSCGAVRGLIAATLFYNIAVVALLVYAWMDSGLFGLGFWPAVLAHAALAVWCVNILAKSII